MTGPSERPPQRSYLERVRCPKCAHFASWKLDANGNVTDGTAASYRCAIMACRHEHGAGT